MLVFLKTLHFISLWAAGGLGVGGWVLQHVHKRNGQRPSVEVVQSIRVMGVLALIAVLALWITGYLLGGMIYGGLPTSGAFHAKLTGATLILICSLGANLETLRSMRAGTPPPLSYSPLTPPTNIEGWDLGVAGVVKRKKKEG